MHIFIVTICILLVNLFFGYWRANTKKFTLPWILAIHIPVPIAIGLRLALLGWSWLLVPAFVVDYTAGQYLGGKLRHWMVKQTDIQLSSCLVADVGKILFARRGKNTLAQ